MFRNVIFDWSGVINDNLQDVLNTVNDMFLKLGGKKISKREFRKEWESPYMNFYNKYFPALTQKEEKKLFAQSLKKFNSRKVYPGVKRVLEKFKANGIKMTILSSDLKHTIFKEVSNYGMRNLFDQIYFDIYNKKEMTDAILKALGQKWDKNKIISYAKSNTWDVRINQLLNNFKEIIESRGPDFSEKAFVNEPHR